MGSHSIKKSLVRYLDRKQEQLGFSKEVKSMMFKSILSKLNSLDTKENYREFLLKQLKEIEQ